MSMSARKKYEALAGQNTAALVRDYLAQIEFDQGRGISLQAIYEALRSANPDSPKVQSLTFEGFKTNIARARKARAAKVGAAPAPTPEPADVAPIATPAPVADVRGVTITTPTKKRFDYSTNPGGDMSHILGPAKSEGKK